MIKILTSILKDVPYNVYLWSAENSYPLEYSSFHMKSYICICYISRGVNWHQKQDGVTEASFVQRFSRLRQTKYCDTDFRHLHLFFFLLHPCFPLKSVGVLWNQMFSSFSVYVSENLTSAIFVWKILPHSVTSTRKGREAEHVDCIYNLHYDSSKLVSNFFFAWMAY